MQPGGGDDEEVADHVEDSVWLGQAEERFAPVTKMIIREEGKIVACELVDVCPPDNDVGGDQTEDAEYDEEEDGVESVEPLKHPGPVVRRSVPESVARHEALGQENGAKGCQEVLAPVIGLDGEEGQAVVADDHDEDEEDGEEVKIAGEKRDDESSDENMRNVEDQSGQSPPQLDLPLG